MAQILLPPFAVDRQLVDDDTATQSLRCQIAGTNKKSTPTKDAIESYLQQELHTPILEDLYSHLWLVAKKSSKHIDALHVHQIKKRTITIAEDPGLHIVWHYDTVYLKPILPCLLNCDFWQKHLLPATAPTKPQVEFNRDDLSQDCRTALGFLRSYSYLVAHESDFRIAKTLNLIHEDLDYADFQDFMHCFRSISDEAVSRRYHYGQFRLTRLNWAVRLFHPGPKGSRSLWTYQERHWQTGQYINRFVAPLLFIFAIITTVLSAMQVVIAAQGTATWVEFLRASWGFSVAVLYMNAGVILLVLLGLLGVLVVQGQFAVRMYWRELFAAKASKV
jgi:hypothetical protein